MARARTFERRDARADREHAEKVLGLRAQAPGTVKLEGLLWALAEAQGLDQNAYDGVALVAGWVTDRANEGVELEATTILTALEAALKGLPGVKL